MVIIEHDGITVKREEIEGVVGDSTVKIPLTKSNFDNIVNKYDGKIMYSCQSAQACKLVRSIKKNEIQPLIWHRRKNLLVTDSHGRDDIETELDKYGQALAELINSYVICATQDISISGKMQIDSQGVKEMNISINRDGTGIIILKVLYESKYVKSGASIKIESVQNSIEAFKEIDAGLCGISILAGNIFFDIYAVDRSEEKERELTKGALEIVRKMLRKSDLYYGGTIATAVHRNGTRI